VTWCVAQEEETDYFKKWLNEDVIYIIAAEERAVFEKLTTDAEKEYFIEQFWQRRDSDPRTAYLEFKEEHYRRIAYANERFKSGRDGWLMDRGRISITFGPPDSIESHPTGGPYVRPLEEGGGTTTTYPFEVWYYRYIEGAGQDIYIEFVDPSSSGEYRIALRETEKDALFTTVGAGMTDFEAAGLEDRGGRLRSSDMMRGSGMVGDSVMNRYNNPFLQVEQYVNLQRPPLIKFDDLKTLVESNVFYDQLPFTYEYDVFRYTDETALVPLTVEIDTTKLNYKKLSDSESQRAVVNVYGRVETMTRVIVYEFEDVIVSDLKVDGKKTSALYQRPLPLKKGRFKLTLVVKDVESGKIGSMESLVVVDPPTGQDKLNASSILLADQITSVSYGEWLPDPFVTSSGLKVYPNVRHEFVQGEPLGVYLEMYGIKIDQASRNPHLNVTYEITDQDGNTLEEKNLSEGVVFDETKASLSMVWPEFGLPAGKYRLHFKIVDEISDEVIHPETVFEVIEKN
jgi:GWxTD domain-containing protein